MRKSGFWASDGRLIMGIQKIHIGIVGAGSFAAFAAEAFSKLPTVKLEGITDIDHDAAEKLGRQLDIKVFDAPEEMVVCETIELIYIATPPFLHYSQSKMALLAAKHVICEKPAALKTSEAEELSLLARNSGLLYVVNLMQRYNPLYGMVKRIVEGKILGNFLRGFFENYASDEDLHPDHWFWDPNKSGGIFIEHGVHFFDLFEGWLGTGELVGAIQLERPDMVTRMIDRVQATVWYPGGIVNFYHGFNQPKILDRQEMRLQFERGALTLFEWVPVKIKLLGLLKIEQRNRVREIMGEGRIVQLEPYVNGETKTDHIILEYENILGKKALYQEMLRSMLSDQLGWIRDRNHIRVMDDGNAVRSLRIAEAATGLAQKWQLQHEH
jgi:predicted dehydrogenase